MKFVFTFLVAAFICIGGAFLAFKPISHNFVADVNGTKISLENFKGRYKAIYFGYLYCPDVCPETLLRLGDALGELKRDDFELIFISLDPERDSNEDLTQMAQNFYPHAIGFKVENLDKVTKTYGVKFQKVPMPNSAMIYSVAHSSAVYLLDKDGKFYSEITNLTQNNIKESLQKLLTERP